MRGALIKHPRLQSYLVFHMHISFQAFTTTIIIASANGLVWPYVVIWASSQAKKESLSFLRTIRDVVSTGNFVSFETKKKYEVQKFQHSVVKWKKSERNNKYDRGIKGSVMKSTDDSISISIIQEDGYKQEFEQVQKMGRKVDNDNKYKLASPVKDQVSTTPQTNLDMPLQISSSIATNVELKADDISPNQDKAQLMTLSLLISNSEGIPKRQKLYSRSGLDSLNVHFNKPKDRDINCSIGKQKVKNLMSFSLNNTWTENDMINPQRKLIILDSNKSLKTNDLGNLRASNIFIDTTEDIRASLSKENFVLPVKSSRSKTNNFCSLNVPMSTDFMRESSDCLKSSNRINFSKGNTSISRSRISLKNKTVDVLKTIICDHDNPNKNNMNTIIDPIRRCNNMTSIHLGDYDDSQIE